MKNILIKCGQFHRKHRVKLKIFALIALCLFLLLTPVFYTIALMANEMNKMKESSLATGKINSDIYVIKDIYVNIYLVKSDNGYIMIDTGTKESNLHKGLKDLEISVNEVKTVLLTHSDSDHVGGIELVSHCEIYMSDLEAKVVNNETPRRISSLRIPIRNRVNAMYNLLSDGEVINIDGRRVEVILTPGHTPGSTSYFIDDKYLFTGDTLSILDGEIKGFIKLFTMDIEENLKSIEKLKDKIEKADYIFSQHHGYIKNR